MQTDANRIVAVVAAAVVLAYALLVTSEVLLGLLAAGLLALVVRAGDAIARDLDRRRWLAVDALAVAAFVYLFAFEGARLLAVVVGSLLVLLGWATAPRGPLARAARWIRDAREDLRVVRDAVDAEPGDRGPTEDD